MKILNLIPVLFSLQRANRIARLFVGVAIILLLPSCGLFRAVASPPTAVPLITPAVVVTNTGVGETDQGTPVEGLVDTLAVGSANLLYWSPSTGSLALAGDRDVRLMPLPQRSVQPQSLDQASTLPVTAEAPTLLAGAQSSSRLAWVDSSNKVFSLDPTAGGLALQVAQGDDPVTGLAVSPDGSRLAVATTENNLMILPNSGQPSAQAAQEFDLPVWLTQLSFSPDGKLVGGTDSRNFTVYILDAQNGNVVRTLEWFDSPSASLYGAFFSPDWNRIAWLSQATIQIMNVADGSLGPLLNHEDHVQALAWSQDGTRLATASVIHLDSGPSPVLLIWDPASGAIVTTVPQPSAVRSLAFSPDGNQIAVIDSQQNLQVWNLER